MRRVPAALLAATLAGAVAASAPARPTATSVVTGLVAAYGFNETSGASVTDASGNNNTGAITGATRVAGGKFGGALSFSGSSSNKQFVSVADSSSLHLTAGMTLEAWVYMTGGQNWRTVIFKERTGGMTYALYAKNNGSRPVGQVYVSAEQNVQGTSAVPTGAWTHLATTYDGASQKLYVNGALAATHAQTGSIISSTGSLKIGGNGVWNEWFNGMIDEIRVYNRALSTSEVQTDMNTPVAVDNQPPTAPTALTVTGRTETTISLSWQPSSDNVGVAGYGLYRDSVLVGTSTTTSGTISNASCGTAYNVSVDAFDASSNRSPQAVVTASTSPCDTTPPTVQITSPAGGTTVNGTVTISADAGDNKSVAGVQFKVDGANLGVEDTTAPYSAGWDTTAGGNGAHTLTAEARDGSNNRATSAPVGLTVSNQTPVFVNDKLIIGLSEPTNMVFTPDGRMLVIERAGTVLVVQAGAQAVDPTPLLRLPNVVTADERGLLGIVLDPSFGTNGYLYLFYTSADTQKNQVSRFTAVGNTASLSSETVIWRNDVNADIWHQGGDMHFGPDGKLYVAVGDHLLPDTAQRLNSYNGKILRLNSDGTAPTDNPFYDGTGPNKDGIWALGFRNPFRFSFDSATGRMYVGDVGQNSWEEVDLVTRGANYGWPTCEGNCTVTGMTSPIHTYDHAGGRDACVIGGVVYRGAQFPAEYQGTYIFGDYSQNWIKRLTLDANGNSTGVTNFIPADGSADGPYGDIVAITVGPDGALYYVDNGPFASNNAGSIHRVRNTNSNQPPTAVVSADRTSSPTAPATINFSSAGSSDPEGQPLTYSWDFGDGGTSTAANPAHTYANHGRYTARLTTSDGTSSTASAALVITLGAAPQPTITSPPNGLTFRAGDTIAFSGQATDPDDGTIPPSALSWKVVFHHSTHIHPFIDQVIGASGSFQIPTSGHSFGSDTSYEIVLTATDSDGIQTQASVFIYPQIVTLAFASQPAGLAVKVDGIPQTAPFNYQTLVGFNHTVSVDSPQFLNGSRYDFASWSDGGTLSHTIVAPASSQAYTASFTLVSTAPAGLVAAYNFNEGNLGTLYDVSGHGNDGTLNGPIWTGTGKYGGALSFDGVNDWVTINDSPSIDFINGFTLEAWVNPTALSSWRAVIFKERTGGMLYSLYAHESRDSRPDAQIWLNNGEQDAVGSAILGINTWTHLASTFDGAVLRLYVNGVLVGSKAVAGSLVPTTNPLRLGGNSPWGEWFQGLLDQVKLYNRALSPSEIQTDMNTPL